MSDDEDNAAGGGADAPAHVADGSSRSVRAAMRVVAREPVEGSCPACGAEALARYPVLSSGGWFDAVKCQRCLSSTSRVAWNRLGYVDRDQADRVIGERAVLRS